MRTIKFFLTLVIFSSSALAATDHVLYYKGTIKITDLTEKHQSAWDNPIILKKEILPSKSMFVETATMPDYQGVMRDLTTAVTIDGNKVAARSADGTAVGTGIIEGIGPDGDFTYLDLTFVIVPIQVTVKNVNIITSSQLIARKEIINANGIPTGTWESDMDSISEKEYNELYKKMHQAKGRSEVEVDRFLKSFTL